MQNDCQIYVDPEEDEVFFGCVSEREKSVSAKLVKHAAPSPIEESTLNNIINECDVNDDQDIEKRMGNEKSIETNKAIQPPTEPFIEKISDTSVELEHNYSTPMKHKIDKSILATPKSIVKADKDGGFLKVLSEIALVKAEVEGNTNSEGKKEDEDKENKTTPSIPEIKITEATPEKKAVASPPNVMSTDLRRFRIIYNSPRNEDIKPKSNVENFESERNIKNKRLDQEVELLGSSRTRKSIDLIDFDSIIMLNGDEKREGEKADAKPVSDIIKLMDSPEAEDDVRKEINPRPPVGLRFSKEARKVVEVLKKSSAEETLNFTVPEINVEEEENSFLSPETPSGFDETVITNQNQIKETLKKIPVAQPPIKSKTEGKRTPVASQRKFQSVKYFSERRKCVKKLPMEEKTPVSVEKVNGLPSSRIPVFGAKNSKIPLFERLARSAQVKTTPSKMPSVKSFKNTKFNHIESPINAYIHNKPTALVLNVKPETKKESASKVWKTQAGGTGKKVQEKPSKEQNGNNDVKLPFVEYKSATAYKIEKRPESRLPRLAPKVYKLIGSNSPKVLRHEGRFYMNSPRKENSTESTIVAEPNEVSVVVSQPVQKSRTIK